MFTVLIPLTLEVTATMWINTLNITSVDIMYLS